MKWIRSIDIHHIYLFYFQISFFSQCSNNLLYKILFAYCDFFLVINKMIIIVIVISFLSREFSFGSYSVTRSDVVISQGKYWAKNQLGIVSAWEESEPDLLLLETSRVVCIRYLSLSLSRRGYSQFPQILAGARYRSRETGLKDTGKGWTSSSPARRLL